MSDLPLTRNVREDRSPTDLAAYEANGGYAGLRRAMAEMSPADCLQVVKDSNLRGRGGAGFPTGMKWSFVPMENVSPGHKYLICNADEMEPGTFKDRLLMECDPHQLIEGMILSAYTIQADVAYIFIRAEYLRAAQLLREAIEACREKGYLGRNILGSGYDLEMYVHASAGRYICGEETALISSLEGKRANPRAKPPFPQVSGLWGRPTIVNNVETLCNIPHIVERGADWFQGLGLGDDAGTKLYGVSGRVRDPGCWELPMGTPIREIIEDRAGGMQEGYRLRGFLPGGGSTDFLTDAHLDIPMEYESIGKAGSRMGTGTMIILDDRTCPVGFVKNLIEFFARESCGFCTPCRDGLPWNAQVLGDIEAGRGQPQDLDTLAIHVDYIGAIGNTHCALAPGAMEPLQSALKYFREDFEAHIERGACPYQAGRTSMPVIKLDGREYEVEAGDNLLKACLELGLDLPYFCWHPALGSAGACRQCAVVQYQNEEDQRGRLVMACMTPVTDGAIFSVAGERATDFRETVVESLMVDHPHDCPVCAEGGECHLQDMTVMVGHRDRQYRGKKKTYRNQYLGPLIHHEMNRCITCYRCTRYYQDYAGGTDLAALAAHNYVYFGRHQEGTLESPFAGNLVEVCPTGVFTDKSLVHDYTRKWDLQSAPSVCVGCGLGCNTLAGERYGRLKRIHNRYNHEVNGYFLCDRGRFGGNFVNSPQRLDYPGQRDQEDRFEAITDLACTDLMQEFLSGTRLAAIGSPRAGLEPNLILQNLVGEEQFCSGMDDAEHALLQRILAHLASSPAHNPSLRDIETADAILVLGEDLTHSAPRMALALRQSVRNEAFKLAAELRLESWQDAAIRNLAQDQRSPLHIVSDGSADLDDVAASHARRVAPDQAQMAAAILEGLNNPAGADPATRRICEDLLAAERPLIISGSGARCEALIDTAAAIARTLSADKPAMLSFVVPECNSLGQALLTRNSSASFEDLLRRAAADEFDTLLILENALERRLSAQQIDQLRERVRFWIGIDCLESATLNRCDLVLPAAAFTETESTLINQEGRAQRSFPVHPPAESRRPAWRWLTEIGRHAERPELAAIEHFDQIFSAFGNALPQAIAAAAPDHAFRSQGLKVPRQPHRYSGRTAMRADVSVHEPKAAQDPDSALCFTMEGAARNDRPGALLSYVWAPGWNSNQSLHKFQAEIGGALRGGTAGARVLDDLVAAPPTPAPAPAPFAPQSGQCLLQARQQVFGSDELSRHSPGPAELAGRARLYLHPDDAAALDVTAGDGVEIEGQALEVWLDPEQTAGSAGFSSGYPETLMLRSGQWVSLSRATSWQRAPQVIGSDREGAA